MIRRKAFPVASSSLTRHAWSDGASEAIVATTLEGKMLWGSSS